MVQLFLLGDFMGKLAIVLRAFGSPEPEHRRVREDVLAAYEAAFPDAVLRFVLSSRMVRKAEGLPDFESTIEQLADLGCDMVVVQHILLAPGQMYAEAMELPNGIPCRVGAPLLRTEADADWLAAELAQRVDTQTPTVFAVHGNTRNPQHNHVHMDLWERTQLHLDDARLLLGESRGEPGIQPMLDLQSLRSRVRPAHITPLFLFPRRTCFG